MHTKNGYDDAVWYSPLDQNGNSQEKIIAGMKRRFEATPAMASITQKLNFYDNLAPGKPLIESYP